MIRPVRVHARPVDRGGHLLAWQATVQAYADAIGAGRIEGTIERISEKGNISMYGSRPRRRRSTRFSLSSRGARCSTWRSLSCSGGCWTFQL
jgi:hypothetical protein